MVYLDGVPLEPLIPGCPISLPLYPVLRSLGLQPFCLSGYSRLCMHVRGGSQPNVPASRCCRKSTMALYYPACLPTYYAVCTCTVPRLYISTMYLTLPVLVYMYPVLNLGWRTNSPVLWSSPVHHSPIPKSRGLRHGRCCSATFVPVMYLPHFDLGDSRCLACLPLPLPLPLVYLRG
jgi:hypothetical protein